MNHNPTNRKESHCQCLYEIENNLTRTKFCMVPCRAQREIIGYNIQAKETVNVINLGGLHPIYEDALEEGLLIALKQLP